MTALFPRYLVILFLTACSHLALESDPMLGTWENITNGDRVALVLKDNRQCDLVVERSLKPESRRACQFEKFQDRFLIFLVKQDGLCGSDADFEFIFEKNAPLIHFIVGGSEILMNKKI